MATRVYSVGNEKYVGWDAIEIISFPALNVESQSNTDSVFYSLLNELYKLGGLNTEYELLWSTEPVSNQIFHSKIHIFFVVRKIGNDARNIFSEVEQLCQSVTTSLTTAGFIVEQGEHHMEELQISMDEITGKTLFAVVKRENCVIHSNAAYPYYYCDVIPSDNKGNFSLLISAMSMCKRCMVSFQLFPDGYSVQEQVVLRDIVSDLSRISTGFMIEPGRFYKDPQAEEPLRTYSYYNNAITSALFRFNILISGERGDCANLATKVISHLQQGTGKISTNTFSVLDLSEERINLKRWFVSYGWHVNNLLFTKYRNPNLKKTILALKMPRLAFLLSVEEASVFFCLPYYEENMTAIKSNKNIRLQEQFAEGVVDKDNIQFGKLLGNENQEINIGCEPNIFTRHALIVGMPGTGKTTFSVNLLLQMYKKEIPFLVIEPTKTEYRAMIDSIPDLQIFTPGNNGISPFVINPFIPPKDITVEQYIPSLASAFKAAFSMPSPLDTIFQEAIQAAYIKYGWKDYSKADDSDVQTFGLHEFILVFKELIKNSSYSAEVKGNLRSGGIVRLRNLIEQNSNIYDTTQTIPLEDILSKPTVLELNAIDNEEQKSVLIALLLINICVYTKHNHVGDGKLKNMILIDEAHVLFKADVNAQGANSTVRSLENMVAEIRSYGTSIVIADQSPSAVGAEVVKNTDIKVIFRLIDANDRKNIETVTGMTGEMEQRIPDLGKGQAFVSCSLLKTPVIVQTPDIREKESIRLSVSNAEIHERMEYWKEHSEYLKPFNECKYSLICNECNLKVRSDASFYAARFLQEYGTKITDITTVRKALNTVDKWLDRQNPLEQERNQLTNCIKIRLMRSIMQQKEIGVGEKEYQSILKLEIGKEM